MAYSLNSVREHPPGGARLGLVASSLAGAGRAPHRRRCRAWPTPLADPIRDGRGIYYWDEPLLNGGRRAWLSSSRAKGSQYPGMLADLCFHFPEVRRLFDTADRIARDLGETVPPSEHLFGRVHGGDEKLWSTATAVNVVLNAQWALYQVLDAGWACSPTRCSGHSSGEMLALSAAGVFQTDRALERKLGRLGAIMSGFESSGDLPAARLVAVAAHSDRVEALCRDAGRRRRRQSRWTIALTRSFWPCRSAELEPRARPSARGEHPVRGASIFACLPHAEFPPGRRSRSPISSIR